VRASDLEHAPERGRELDRGDLDREHHGPSAAGGPGRRAGPCDRAPPGSGT
jgi:hypothetical protein